MLFSTEDFKKHESTKLLARITKAYVEIIPQNPNHPDYYLRGMLSKFRRYKRGLQRYRLLFCFSQQIPIIIYLYINDKDHLRKDGGINDPYKEFSDLIKRGIFSSDPHDPIMQQWISKRLFSPNMRFQKDLENPQ